MVKTTGDAEEDGRVGSSHRGEPSAASESRVRGWWRRDGDRTEDFVETWALVSLSLLISSNDWFSFLLLRSGESNPRSPHFPCPHPSGQTQFRCPSVCPPPPATSHPSTGGRNSNLHQTHQASCYPGEKPRRL